MPLRMKLFDTLGAVTLVTPPSMVNPQEVNFLLINLEESEKNEFAKALNEIFPKDNVTVFLYNHIGQNAWLRQCILKAKYILLNDTNVPIWISEMLEGRDVYKINESHKVKETFLVIKNSQNKEE